ncbi:MAG: hypothetical protein KKG33_05680 [candidate division Zixibacteria bacterium]|nr:hypothetical protein [candidate division Zixibacteria bacterium]
MNYESIGIGSAGENRMPRRNREDGVMTASSPRNRGSKAVSKKDLSTPRKRLVELMQWINNGRIRGLEVRCDEPVLDPLPIILRTCKFGGDNQPNAALSSKDYVLKKNVTEMFEILDREQSFLIEELVVVDGLPVHMTMKGTVQM